MCVCVCRALHRHFAGQWLKPEKVSQTRKRAPSVTPIEDKGNHITALQQSMASWDHKSDDLAVSLFKISAFRSFFTLKLVPPTISHRSDLTSFTPFLYLPILKCDRLKSDYVDTVYRLSIV